MLRCYHCGEETVGWVGDFTFEDYCDDDGDGIYQIFHCGNCGADIEFRIPFGNDDDQTEEKDMDCE